MDRAALITALTEGRFTNVGQLAKADDAWLGRQRRAGKVVAVGWSVFNRPIYGFAA